MRYLLRVDHVKKQIFHCLVLHSTLGSNDPSSTHLVRNRTISKTHTSLVGTWLLVVLAVLSFRHPEEAGPRPNPSYGVPMKDPGELHNRTRPTQDL